MRVATAGIVVGVFCAGCSASRQAEREATPSTPATVGELTGGRDAPAAVPHADDEGSGNALRVLGVSATFGDLVAAARRLDDRDRGDVEAGCLLRGGGAAGTPWRLEADLAVAVRPLPEAPDELAPRFEGTRGPVRVLSRWGYHGPTGKADVPTFVAFTSAPPPGNDAIFVLALTRDGVYARSTDGEIATAHRGPFSLANIGEHLGRVTESTTYGTVAVTATASTSLERLRRLLAALQDGASVPVALASLLYENTKVPEPPRARAAPGGEDAGACPDGLPAPSAEAAEGKLGRASLVTALEPLRDAARKCMADARGPAVAGGDLTVMLRIGTDGRVKHACVRRDAIGAPALRDCILEAARDLGFPEPDPAGFVDVALPLTLEPSDSLRQRPLCAPPRAR